MSAALTTAASALAQQIAALKGNDRRLALHTVLLMLCDVDDDAEQYIWNAAADIRSDLMTAADSILDNGDDQPDEMWFYAAMEWSNALRARQIDDELARVAA
jgi:hypothetical protein